MKTTRKSVLSSILLSITVLFFLLASCKKKEDNPATPDIPPQSSFVMTFNDFSNPDDTLGNRNINSYQNWGFSYLNVSFWNTVISVGLAVPVASFVESFNHEAVYHPDQGNWTWTYNFYVNQVAFEAELTAYRENDNVNWEMRITKGNQYSNFLWYTGVSAINGNGGYWILKENPDNPNDLLKIDWNRNGDGTANISYTNIRPGDPENGGFIYYGTYSGEFDRFYSIYNKGLDNHTDIYWNSVQKYGHVTDSLHFGDNLPHCWDSQLQDTVCP